jgi:pSer/pThr/pTyr-binding forkhead associated (FHA) protein
VSHVDLATVLISGAVGAVTSAITAYLTSRLKITEEGRKWSRELSQKYAEALATNPDVALKIARQFGIALIVTSPLDQDEYTPKGKYFLLPNARLLVGRSPNCDIQLDDRLISLQQAAYSADSEHVYLENMMATHPTMVNGKPVNGRVRLRSGDLVTMGRTRFDLVMFT